MRNCSKKKKKEQSPPSPTSTGLNPSWRNLKFNNIVDQSDNIVWLFKFCSGPGFNSISPNVKSFILETQCLLVLLVDFAILWLFKQGVVIRLLFCKGLLAVTRFSFKKWKNIHICTDVLHTITYSESLSHIQSGRFRSIFSENTLQLAPNFSLFHGSCNLFRSSRRLSVSKLFHLWILYIKSFSAI